MMKSLWLRSHKIKQSQKLMLISKEATRIRKLQEEQKIDAREAGRLLRKLRQEPDAALGLLGDEKSATAA
ncbi:MAG: hypothetical protein MJH10_17195 [Epibacterium sp.]|nr:hypothetical protein [Epibacterium sp.]NQX75245.1 hypothetical protein [Epibacterium sp.]